MSAWWFVQNAQQYAGDFMGTKTMYNSWARTFHHDLHYYLPPSHIIKSLRWWRMSFFSFWGLFGYMNKYLWRPVYFGYLGMVLAAVLGGLNGLRHMRMKKPQSKAIVIWSSLALVLIINLSSMIWASVHNLGGPQGRYLITSEIPIMALIIGGLNQLGQKWGRGFILAFLAFNAIVSLGSWIYLFHLYHGWHLNPLL